MEQYSIQVQIENNRNDYPEENVAYTVVLTNSQMQPLMLAYDALDMFFGMCLQTKVFDKNIGNILLKYLFS
jgi:hypothetical protein